MKLNLLGFVVFVFAFADANAQSVPTLAKFDLSLATTQNLPLAKRIRFELWTSNPDAIAKALLDWENVDTSLIDANKLLVEINKRPQFLGTETEKYLLDTFVIDFNEKSSKAFISGFTRTKNKPIELSQLETYVDEYINQPTYIHGFNIASVVASQRSGDCTEYAVLLTALARSLGLPARVIIGTVIVEEKTEVNAFGHAWVEVWTNRQWQIVDAALLRSQANQTFYLPASTLDNEGPGYKFSLAKATALLPNKIAGLHSPSN